MAERNVILIAGNDENNRKLLSRPLADDYDILEVEDGKQVLAEIQKRGANWLLYCWTGIFPLSAPIRFCR